MKKLVAFPWFGGKTEHLKWLLPIIDGIQHTTYVEPYGGSAAVLLNKKPSPVEAYNDICSEVVNFFRILRTRRDELLPLLELTPYSREEFAEACEHPGKDDLERAKQFFIKARQVRSGLATTASAGRWSYGKDQSRRGMAMHVSRWLTAIDGLEDVCTRLRTVQIEHLDGIEVMRRYDSATALHYVDPPYLADTRSSYNEYEFEMDESKHTALLEFLKTLKGRVVLSGYASQMYTDALKGWQEHRAEAKAAHSTQQGCETLALRQEVVWVK